MKLPTLNGWLSWSYNDIPYSIRPNKDASYKFHINASVDRSVKTYKEELYNNATAMRDYFSDPFDVLLSGGIDSEVVVRTFKDLGIKHNTFIFRFEDNYNLRDVDSAVELCKCLNIPYNIIDINLKKFFETDAYDLFKKSKCIRAARLPHIKFLEYLDNIPVMGEGEPYWWRTLENDYSSVSTWTFPINESNHNCSMYLHSIGRENACDWYEFTPELIKSFNQHPIIKDLINDNLINKKSSWSSRLPIHREIWPDMVAKEKLTGYEQDKKSGTFPDFIIELQSVMTKEIGPGQEYWLTVEQLTKLF